MAKMTINEAIAKIDELKPNSFSQTDKIGWLSELDSRIKTEIIDTHEGAEAVEFNGYNDDTDLETELLVPSPYDGMYLALLESKIDYYNGELDRYNNSVTTFNVHYSNYERYYNRMHMPLGHKFKYF